jgi:peptidoglycan-associated lipoprotein
MLRNSIKFSISTQSIKGALFMFYKFFISIFMVLFVAACATTPKDSADSSGSGSSSSESDVSSSEGVITETAGSGIVSGSQEDLIVNVGDRVFFGYDSSDLDSDALELLQDQVAWLKQNSDVSVTIEGHCDERGTREYNLALGEKRAQAVKNYLIGLGINPDRVSTISYGKERPAVVGSNDGAWAQNRRSVTVVN